MQKSVIYLQKYLKKNYRKVRVHCHYTGDYTGAVHRMCNLIKNIVPKKVL